jgi:hypothetical protein
LFASWFDPRWHPPTTKIIDALQVTGGRPGGNDQGVHRLDSDLRLAPLHASVDELVSVFNSPSEIDILQRHGNWLKGDHERVHHAAMEPGQTKLKPEFLPLTQTWNRRREGP